MTGNYIAQADIEMKINAITNAIGIGTATVMGGLHGGPLGAAVGFGISFGTSAINYNLQQRTLQTNIAKLDTYANIMRERSGNVDNNGSRGTEY